MPTHPITAQTDLEWRTYEDHAADLRRRIARAGYAPDYLGPGYLWRLARRGAAESTAGDLEGPRRV